MAKSLHGIAASSGIAFGKAYKLVEPDLSFNKIRIENSDAEIKRFHEAIKKTKHELEQIRSKVALEQGKENAAIFDAHLLVLHDPELIPSIEDKINDEKTNAENALHGATNFFIEIFEQLDIEYMRARVADVKDVTKRILAHLLGKELPSLELINKETILIATELSPSDTALMNKHFIKGFVTDNGGRTSHSAIMARTLELPAVVGTREVTTSVKENDYLILDGLNGKVIINPSEEVRKQYMQKDKIFQVKKAEWNLLINKPTTTIDNKKVKLVANINSANDIEMVIQSGAEGIGLYRTEYLYMNNTSLPTEDEQFEAYKTVLEMMNEKPVVVRTLDIGGDKQLPYMKISNELNPFLGLRGIRHSLKETDIFRTQLRALLRASTYGNLKIMFPMIATLNEFREAKRILQEEKQKLLIEGVTVSEKMEVGIMVEIPSTAMLADQFAKEVDFFSIGANDLIQYTFAADRMNEDVSYLYQPYHPIMLRLIKSIIDAAHKEGKWTGMCGEMACDPYAIPLLLGLGLDEFSMSAPSILQTRSQIKKLKKESMSKLAEQAMELDTASDVKNLIDANI